VVGASSSLKDLAVQLSSGLASQLARHRVPGMTPARLRTCFLEVKGEPCSSWVASAPPFHQLHDRCGDSTQVMPKVGNEDSHHVSHHKIGTKEAPWASSPSAGRTINRWQASPLGLEAGCWPSLQGLMDKDLGPGSDSAQPGEEKNMGRVHKCSAAILRFSSDL